MIKLLNKLSQNQLNRKQKRHKEFEASSDSGETGANSSIDSEMNPQEMAAMLETARVLVNKANQEQNQVKQTVLKYDYLPKGGSISVIMENQQKQVKLRDQMRLNNRRSSIGSLTEVHFSDNWVQQLDTFIRRFYNTTMNKLNTGKNISARQLNGPGELAEFLELEKDCKLFC